MIKSQFQLMLVNLLHPLFLHANTSTQKLSWQPFLSKIHIIFYYQDANFRNATYGKVHLDLLQSFLKIKLKGHSQFSKKFVDLQSLILCFKSLDLTILSSHKNFSNMLYLIMKILTEKKYSVTSISLTFRQRPYSTLTITKTS